MPNGLWKLVEYPNVLDGFRAACKGNNQLLAALDVCLSKVRQNGPECGMPTAEYLGEGLYQIRPKTHERQGRILYSINLKERKIIFLCWFFKTTKKTPIGYMKLAKLRLKALEDGTGIKKGGRNGQRS